MYIKKLSHADYEFAILSRTWGEISSQVVQHFRECRRHAEKACNALGSFQSQGVFQFSSEVNLMIYLMFKARKRFRWNDHFQALFRLVLFWNS